jgi:hypothetical protein
LCEFDRQICICPHLPTISPYTTHRTTLASYVYSDEEEKHVIYFCLWKYRTLPLAGQVLPVCGYLAGWLGVSVFLFHLFSLSPHTTQVERWFTSLKAGCPKLKEVPHSYHLYPVPLYDCMQLYAFICTNNSSCYFTSYGVRFRITRICTPVYAITGMRRGR